MDAEAPSQNRFRLSLASAAVAAITALAVFSSLDATQGLTRQTETLVNAEIPKLRLINALLAETERASLELHLYYATQELAHWEAVENSGAHFSSLLRDLQRTDVASTEISSLATSRGAFEAEARAFHAEMQNRPGRSWDRLRTLLSDAHGHTLAMGNVLTTWAGSIQSDVQRGGQDTMAKLQRLSVLQTVFAVALGGWALGLIILYRARVRDQHALHELAYFDIATGLPNRRHFLSAWQPGEAAKGAALLQVGIDDFKSITSSFGHSLAQELARLVASNLEQTVANNCMARHRVFALSNSEWLVWMVDPAPSAAADKLAATLLGALENRLSVGNFDIPVAISIGVTCAPEHGTDSEQLLRNADAALQATRKQSGVRHRLYSPESSEQTRKFLDTQLALVDALANDEFELHLQPKMDTRSRRCIGAEALLRWRHNGALVPPGDFIPVAERSGLIEPIGAWVLREGVRLAAVLREAGYLDVPLAVNVSPRQLTQHGFCKTVEKVIRHHDIPPDALELEVTEAAMLGGTDAETLLLEKLRSLGVRLAIDDFGTGYSSLSYLTRFPFDVLKIDRKFIMNMTESRRDRHVVKSILSLASSLDYKVIAEGVETQEQVAALQELGCFNVQGFFYSRALPQPEFLEFLAGANREPGACLVHQAIT
ncbi:MAG: bifunctional diguanylate cyclase/phosphodiesterase [Pseudomonadota bacterium]